MDGPMACGNQKGGSVSQAWLILAFISDDRLLKAWDVELETRDGNPQSSVEMTCGGGPRHEKLRSSQELGIPAMSQRWVERPNQLNL